MTTQAHIFSIDHKQKIHRYYQRTQFKSIKTSMVRVRPTGSSFSLPAAITLQIHSPDGATSTATQSYLHYTAKTSYYALRKSLKHSTWQLKRKIHYTPKSTSPSRDNIILSLTNKTKTMFSWQHKTTRRSNELYTMLAYCAHSLHYIGSNHRAKTYSEMSRNVLMTMTPTITV